MSSQAPPAVRKFNPGLCQSDQKIREQFVVRHHELALVLDELKKNIGPPSCQHVLVVGPRGRGKTMLLARVAAELRSSPDFVGSLLPVRFMEEVHEIFSLTDFWLEIMLHLAVEVEARDPALAQELRDTRAALSLRWRERITEAQARAAVLDATERLGRRLVLIVENLQSLFRDAHDHFGWQLREVLQTEPQVMLLASATSRFRALDDASQPFFEMLRIVPLEPLDTEDCRRLWEVASGTRTSRSEVRPMQILTGGNPRLLVMAAEFARHRSLRRLMSELVAVIDSHTEYFRGHLEALPKTERRVYLAVADLWQPSSAGEISARARVDIRVASTMLGRLVARGAVVRQGHGRKRLYAAAEPLYSVYYKLRRDRDRTSVVENLIRFMVACYGLEDLVGFVTALSAESAESGVLRRGVRRAVATRAAVGDRGEDMKWGTIEQVSHMADALAESVATKRLRADVVAALAEERYEKVVSLIEEYASRGWLESPESMADMRLAWTTYHLAFAHAQLGNAPAVLSVTDRIMGLADNSHSTILAWTARTLVARAAAQLELGDYDGAVAGCDDIIRRFGSWPHRPFDAVVAESLVIRGCAKAGLDDDLGAICDYDDAVKRCASSALPEVQAILVAALMRKALSCRRLGDRQGEIRAYDAVIERCDGSDALEVRQGAMVALSYKCLALAEIGRADESLETCGELEIATSRWPRSGDDRYAEGWIEWLTWRAGGARSLALAVQRDHCAALDWFQTAYAVFPTNQSTATQEMLNLVAQLVARDVAPQDLLTILSGDSARSSGLRPLTIALHQRAGDRIRAPREEEEVAADMRSRFRAAEEQVSARRESTD